MLWLKEKAKEMIREQVALRQRREELQGDNKWIFCKLERGTTMEAPAAANCRNLEAQITAADVGRP